MKKKSRKFVAVFMAAVMFMLSFPVYADDNISIEENVIVPRSLCERIFEVHGIDVEDTAYFQTREVARPNTNVSVDALSMVVETDDGVEETVLIGYDEENEVVGINTLVRELMVMEEAGVEICASGSLTFRTITATATYLKTNNGDQYFYRPTKLSFKDSRADDDVVVAYAIYGSLYSSALVDLNDIGGHEIVISKDSVTAGTTYSKQGTTSYYYYFSGTPNIQQHRLTIQIGSVWDEMTLDMTSIVI